VDVSNFDTEISYYCLHFITYKRTALKHLGLLYQIMMRGSN